MDVPALRARLRRAELVLGLVEETVPRFAAGSHPRVGFVSFDLDYYTATMSALRIFDAGHEQLLPRVLCYFDDMNWYPYTEFNGERAAINDFNAAHEQRKLSPMYGLALRMTWPEKRQQWPHQMYIAELFDHPLFAAPEERALIDLTLAG
jgi:hypothetical protein